MGTAHLGPGPPSQERDVFNERGGEGLYAYGARRRRGTVGSGGIHVLNWQLFSSAGAVVQSERTLKALTQATVGFVWFRSPADFSQDTPSSVFTCMGLFMCLFWMFHGGLLQTIAYAKVLKERLRRSWIRVIKSTSDTACVRVWGRGGRKTEISEKLRERIKWGKETKKSNPGLI